MPKWAPTAKWPKSLQKDPNVFQKPRLGFQKGQIGSRPKLILKGKAVSWSGLKASGLGQV